MRGAEGVVDEDIGKRRKLFGKLGIVFRLALFKARILKKHDLAVFERSGQRLCAFAHDVLRHLHGLAQKLGQAVCHDLQRERGIGAVLGLTHVRAENDARTMLDKIFDRRQRRDNALVAGDLAVFGGDVKVAAAQNALSADVDVFHGFLVVIHRDSSLLPEYRGGSTVSAHPKPFTGKRPQLTS